MLFAELVGQDDSSRRPLFDGASEARNLKDGEELGEGGHVQMVAMARGIQVSLLYRFCVVIFVAIFENYIYKKASSH